MCDNVKTLLKKMEPVPTAAPDATSDAAPTGSPADADARREIRQMSPAALAFLGDAVFELLARAHFVRGSHKPADALHRDTVKLVNAGFQARAAALLQPLLTSEEQDVLRRGRNLNSDHVPKHSDPVSYRHATGLETLFGYLYLCGDRERLESLFSRILSAAGPNAAR